MKTGYIKTVGWLLLCSAALLCSCDGDDDQDGSRHYRLTVKSIDPDFENIKEHVALYFFDENRKLDKIVPCELDKESDIKGAYNKKYTVIAFGYSSDMPVIPLGTQIEQARITLSESSFADNIVADSPGDIFYGRVDLKGGCSNVKDIIWIRRKVAALTIITRNLQSQLNTTDVDFSYIVRQTYGTFDFEGKFNGNKVAYHPESYINSFDHDLVAPKFYTYPSYESGGFSIDIYKGTSLIATYSADSDERQMLLKEGKHTVVFIDFNNLGNDGFLDITCTQKDWVDDNINEGFN